MIEKKGLYVLVGLVVSDWVDYSPNRVNNPGY